MIDTKYPYRLQERTVERLRGVHRADADGNCEHCGEPMPCFSADIISAILDVQSHAPIRKDSG